MRKHRIIAISIAALVLLGLSVSFLAMPKWVRDDLYFAVFPVTPLHKRRQLSGFDDRKVIKIGIPGPLDAIKETNLFLEGVELAIAECNEEASLPLAIETVISNDNNRIADVLTVAGDYAKDTDVVAAIGHWGSDFSMAAAQVYENAGVIMLTPVSTNPKLTERNFRYVFRNAPTDIAIANFMAEYAHHQGYRNVVSLYSKDMTGIQVSHSFENRAQQLGIRVQDKHSVYYDLEDLDENYERWTERGMDAIFIADIITRNEVFRERLVSKNPLLPLLATDAYDYDAPLKALSKLAQNIHVITFYNPDAHGKAYADFHEKFQGKYGVAPDYWAMQGYDSVRIILEAIRTAASLSPDDIADALRHVSFAGVSSDDIRFHDNGDAVFQSLYVKRILNGEISYWGKEDL